MARIVLPADFSGTKTLTEDINKKHTADGSKSLLIPFMQQQGFNIADDVKSMGAAQTLFTAAGLLARQKENYRELRNNSFNPVFKNLQDEVQFLKKLYRSNVQQLGDWGITVNAKSRINYPVDFIGRTVVFQNFAAKFASYPAGTSPLQPFLDENAIDPIADAAAVNQALEYHTKFLQAGKEAEEKNNLVQVLVLPVQEHNRGTGQYLMGLFTKTPKKLGEWGFVVDDNARAPKLRTTTLKSAETITLKGLSLGTVLTNLGAGDLHVYIGANSKGTPQIVHNEELVGIIKGMSVVTVVNPSALQPVKFTYYYNV